ncbi:MafI family immunity protein [Snodgrassella gandavensis]|uniref:MafI family immunity protein n=1 Tax=Snodgrassella gandavensis TaxID=2946698 RepID=UPI001EF68E41|nr:MafI family immunity protein [Snodgrassella gandavensis]
MKYLDEEIKKFGWLFKDRLKNDLLQDAIHYVDCNERGLAFETICDQLSEYEIPITKLEYDIAIEICNELEMNTNDISIKHLAELIVN